MGDGTGVPLDRFLHLQARKKDAPEQKHTHTLSLSLSFFLSIPVAISLSFVLSLAFSLFPCPYLYLSLTHSQPLYLTLCTMEAGVLFTFSVFSSKKRHPKRKHLGVSLLLV